MRSGHPWIYRSDVVSSEAEPGDIVRVASERGRPIGWAFWSSASQIALRMVAVAPPGPHAGATDAPEGDERAWFTARIRAAIDYRASLGIDATACRLVNAEADRLPGLIVDAYGDGATECLVMQTLCQATDRRRDLIAEVLVELRAPQGILARNDPKVRRLEGLEERIDVVFGAIPDVLDIREGASVLRVDVRHGQKTGLFLDQRENHEAATRYARGRVLDAFTYQGGFALALARHADHVLAIDGSAPALELVRANAVRNGLANIETREANVFDELRELALTDERFDLIVLDPPAFAKNRASVDRAVAGYKEINLRAMKLLVPGGHLVTCSCSYNVDETMFQTIVESAAVDAHVTMALVEKRLQARDHPVLVGVPETSYLKCLILRRVV